MKAEFIASNLFARSRAESSSPPRRPAPAREPRSETTSAEQPVGTMIDLPSAGDFTVPIVGESHRQAALKALAGERRMKGEEVIFTAALVPEPSNPYDP